MEPSSPRPPKRPLSAPANSPETAPATSRPAPLSGAVDQHVPTRQTETAASVDPDRDERIAYLQKLVPERPKRRWPKVLGWTLVVLVLLAGAIAGWWYGLRSKPVPATTQATKSASAGSSQQSTAKPVMKHYDSNTFGLGIDYPEQWTTTEANNSLIVASPKTDVQTASKGKQEGRWVLTVQSTTTAIDGFSKGNATAVLDSQKISYTKPSQNQRAQTYLSFLGYADTGANGLDAIFVTGDNGYQKGQAIPLVDVQKADPHIMLSFRSCTPASGTPAASDTGCTPLGGQVLTVSPDLWKDPSVNVPILAMLQSIVVQ